jgi:ribonuclease P protein subunit POP4
MRKTTNILRHELIGLDVEVVNAQNESLIGIKGVVVDETKNCLIIGTEEGEKKVLKKGVEIKTKVDGKEIIITGDFLVGKPEERIKK